MMRWFASEMNSDSIYRIDGKNEEKYEGMGVWRAFPVAYRFASGELEEITEAEAKKGMENWDKKRPEWLKENVPDSKFYG